MPLAKKVSSGKQNQGNQWGNTGPEGNIKTLKDAGKVQRSRGAANSPSDPNHEIIKTGKTGRSYDA